jgi:Tfp pilus assembly protein PilN
VLAEQRSATEKVVQSVYAQRTLVADILDEMSLVVPENVWFQSLSITTADPAPTAVGAGAPADNSLSLEGNTYSFCNDNGCWSN